MSLSRSWTLLLIGLIATYALVTRAMGFLQPYHHDEYKWALAANPAFGMTDTIPHPFLARWLYEQVGGLFGYDYLRIVPIVLSLVLMTLLYIWVRKWYGEIEAVVALALFALCAYALLGSVQIDIDGALLPLIALVTIAAYLSVIAQTEPQKRSRALIVMCAAMVVGFVSKLSFVLVPATLALHFLLTQSASVRAGLARTRTLLIVAAVAVLGIIVVAFSWEHVQFFRYVDNFLALANRDYVQIMFQTVKAALFLSPLMVFGAILAWRYRSDLLIWYLFLGANILFYFVVFDFSHRTFDRYLLFLVLPLVVITSVWMARMMREMDPRSLQRGISVLIATIIASCVAAGLIASQPHRVIPLIPKTGFIEAFRSGQWDFLLPMTGGSGPLGFYLPFDAIAFLWIVAALSLLALVLYRRSLGVYAVAVLVGVSMVHTGMVTREYLTGASFGFAPAVVSTLLVHTAQLTEGRVLTYNDIAAYDLYTQNRYGARFYPHTDFIPENIEKLRAHEGVYMVVQMPAIDPSSVYGQFFARCETLAFAEDKQISGAILDCDEAKAQLP